MKWKKKGKKNLQQTQEMPYDISRAYLTLSLTSFPWPNVRTSWYMSQHNIDMIYLSLSQVTCLHIFVRIATQCIFFPPKFFVSLPQLQTTCCVVWAQVFLSFCLIFLLTNICVHIGLSTTSGECCHHYHNAAAQWKGRMMMTQWAQRVHCSLFSLFLLLTIYI